MRLWTLTLIALILPCAAPAQQNPLCAPRESVISQLKTRFGETPRSIGLATQGQMMELFASEETGSWTIAVTLPTGTTCLLATGQNFETVTPRVDLPSAPA